MIFPKNMSAEKVRRALLEKYPMIIETDNAEASLIDLSFQSPIYPERHVWIAVGDPEVYDDINLIEYDIDLEDTNVEDAYPEDEWDDAVQRKNTDSIEECVMIVGNWLFDKSPSSG